MTVEPFVVLIPARLASTRLPDKPLADIEGVPMVVRVARQANASGASRCVVAADAPTIVQACTSFGVEAILTRSDHPSGSDRLAEACSLLGFDGDQLVVNVQGDEPLIEPSLVAAVAAQLARRSDCVMSTAAHPISNWSEFCNPNVVKVVTDHLDRALYFSRAPIPWDRDSMSTLPVDGPLLPPGPLRHLGIYAYRAGFLRQFPSLSQAAVETCESLEQLRVLWHGHRIAVHVTADSPGPGVDTPEDLERVRSIVRASLAATRV